MWATIHYICLGAGKTIDPARQQALRQFFLSLPTVIPCHKCSEHLSQNLQQIPIDNALSSSDDLFKWSVDLHNFVNKQLGKKTVSHEEAQQIWNAHPQLKTGAQPAPTMSMMQTRPGVEKYVLFVVGLLIGFAMFFGFNRMLN